MLLAPMNPTLSSLTSIHPLQDQRHLLSDLQGVASQVHELPVGAPRAAHPTTHLLLFPPLPSSHLLPDLQKVASQQVRMLLAVARSEVHELGVGAPHVAPPLVQPRVLHEGDERHKVGHLCGVGQGNKT